MCTKVETKQIILVMLFGFSLIASCPGFAQFSVSERTYKKLKKVERLMEKKSYRDAQEVLDQLKSSAANRKYELALVYQALGYLYYETNKYNDAITQFEKSLQLNASPEPVLQSIKLNLVQLYSIANNYQKAVEKFEDWLKKESSPSGDRLALGGSLYAQLKQFDLAIKLLNRAIESTKHPQEAWYRTLLSIYFQQENYRSTSRLLQKLITLNPDKAEYWKQLYTSYYLLNDYRKALSTLELAYNKGLANDEEQITNLAKLYIQQRTPMKAASLLNKELDSNRINKSDKNLRLLATAYEQAQEIEKAATVYLQLSQANKNTDLKLQAARLYMEARQWQQVVNVLNNSENKPKNAQVDLLKGMALVELGQTDKAIKAFTKAKDHADTRISANQWLEFLSTHQPDTESTTP